MPAGPAVKVGLFVFIALIAFTVVALFLTGYRMRIAGYPITVVYDDVLGVAKGSEVRMAGVTIGVVDKPTLDAYQRAVVPLVINQKYRIPKGSRFVLRIGMLIGDKYIDIIPKRGAMEFLKPGAKVAGEIPAGLDSLLPQAQKLISSLQETSEAVKSVLADPQLQVHLRSSLASLDRALGSFDSAAEKLNQAMLSVQATAHVIHGTVAEQQEDICATVENVRASSENLRIFSENLKVLAEEGNIPENVTATLAAARQATESLDRSVESLETLVTSPELQQDFRDTVKGAKQAVQEARVVIDRVGNVFGTKKSILETNTLTRATNIKGVFRTTDGRFRTTLQGTVPIAEDSFIRLGIYDLGVSNKAIIQPGQPLNDNLDLRYGLYASKLGVGLDYNLSPKVYGTADLFNTEEPRLDLEAGYMVTENLGLVLGIDQLLKKNEVMLGIRLSK